jgi:hypothetical protein
LVAAKQEPDPNSVAAETPILKNFEVVVTSGSELKPLTVIEGI